MFIMQTSFKSACFEKYIFTETIMLNRKYCNQNDIDLLNFIKNS